MSEQPPGNSTATSPTPARSIIDALADEGEFVDEGVFTLDRTRALEKLGAHRLADPDAWLLFWVQLGHLLSARSIEIGCGPEKSEVFLAHVIIPNEWLDDPFGGVLRGSDSTPEGRRLSRARQRLSMSIAQVLGLELEAFEVRCVLAGGRGTRARFQRDGGDTVERDIPLKGSVGTHVRIVYAGAIDGGRAMRQLRTLRERCRFCRIDVHVAGQHAAHGWRRILESGEKILPPVGISSDAGAEIGVAGIRSNRRLPSEIVLQMDGVVIETIVSRPNSVAGFVALVEDEFNLDLSQGKIIRDAKFEEIMGAVDRAHDQVRQAMETRVEKTESATRGGETATKPVAAPGPSIVEQNQEPGDEVTAGNHFMMLGLVVVAVGLLLGHMMDLWIIVIGAVTAGLFIMALGAREGSDES